MTKTKPKDKVPLEREVQARIIKRYQKQGYIVVKMILTNIGGFPDLMLLKDGKVSFVEVKRPGETPRPLQSYQLERLEKEGFETYVLCE